MTASRDTIARWFDEGVKQGATHMIVRMDWFDGQCYPIFVTSGDDPHEVASENTQDRLMEVYFLEPQLKEQQMRETRAYNFDRPEVAPRPLVNVSFQWSDQYGTCYECGLPAAFALPLAYNDIEQTTWEFNRDTFVIEDKHKRCAVCAANAAVDGDAVVRIEDYEANLR